MTYAFTHMGNFLLLGLDLFAGIWASRMGFEPRGWDLSLKAGIWASRLGFGPRWGWTEKKKKEKEKKEEEKFPLCEKASVIGPFGAAAQKGKSKKLSRSQKAEGTSFFRLFFPNQHRLTKAACSSVTHCVRFASSTTSSHNFLAASKAA